MNKNQEIVSEFLDHIRNMRKFSEHTIRAYNTDLNQFLSFLDSYNKKVYLLELDKNLVRNYLVFLDRSGKSSKSIARKIATLKSLYKFLTKQGILSVNPMAEIHSPKVNKTLPHLLNQDEILKLMNLPDTSTLKGNRDQAILELFYSTGVRISELVNIKHADLSLESGSIHIHGKGGKDRLVVMGERAAYSLKRYLSVLKTGEKSGTSKFLFPGQIRKENEISDRPIGIKTVYNIVRKYVNLVSEDEKLSPHSLRHSFATHMLENGADLMAVKDLLGHSSLSSTQVYTHIQKRRLKKIYQQAHPDGE